jgi:hypothetical protein
VAWEAAIIDPADSAPAGGTLGRVDRVTTADERRGNAVKAAEAVFYCVADERYFVGAVGLLNSLRLVGHAEPFVVLDCGLSPVQRELVRPHATLVPGRPDDLPVLLKAAAPLSHPADVMVLVDADVVVTRPLTELMDRAAEGRIVAFQNDLARFFPEWGELLGLGPVRRQPYVNAGLLCIGGNVGSQLLELLSDNAARIDRGMTWWGRGDASDPFYFAEQDLLNALLSTAIEPGHLVALEHRLAPTLPSFHGLRIVDQSTLRCAYADGVEPYLLHHIAFKPWLEVVYCNVYARLLTRLLFGADVRLRLDASHVPLRLRTGPFSTVARRAANAHDRARWLVRDRMPRRVAARFGTETAKKVARVRAG